MTAKQVVIHASVLGDPSPESDCFEIEYETTKLVGDVQVEVTESDTSVEVAVRGVFSPPQGKWVAYYDTHRRPVRLGQPLGRRQIVFAKATWPKYSRTV